jgi:hypothetical protein
MAMKMSEKEFEDFLSQSQKEKEARERQKIDPESPAKPPQPHPEIEPAHNAERRELNRQLRESQRHRSLKDRIVNRVKGAIKAAPQKIKSEYKETKDSFSKPKRAEVREGAVREVRRVSANAQKEKAPKFHDYNWSSWASSAPVKKKTKKATKKTPRKAPVQSRREPTQYQSVRFGSSLPVSTFSLGGMGRKTNTKTPITKSYGGLGSYVPISLKDPRYFTTKTKKKAVSKTKKKRRR